MTERRNKWRDMEAVERVMVIASHQFMISLHELKSERRTLPLAKLRQIAMWVAVKETGASYPTIGHAFKRDHTTIMHGYRFVEGRIGVDEKLRRTAEHLREMVRREMAAAA